MLLLLLQLLTLFLVLCVADEQISVKVNESGWAWMVCGERLIIWKICQTAVAKVSHHGVPPPCPTTVQRTRTPNTSSFHSPCPVSLQLSVCKELQLPASEYSYSADLVDVTSAAPLETASVQSVSVLAVAAEGTAHWWPTLAQEGNYTETEVDLGDLCNYVVAVTVSFPTSHPPAGISPGLISGCCLLISTCLRAEASSCPPSRTGW